jgi:flavin reductase (DIM6/NTAB) family NADH-FMN oxidoreductase RutF
MYYEPGRSKHTLSFDPFKSCVVPRPIGWISTTNAEGIDNLSPFSQFQNVTFDPPTVLFIANQRSSGGRKDTVRNCEESGEFVWNMATYALRAAVNATSEEFEPGVDEFERAGLAKAPSMLVRPPRVARSPIHFECRYIQTIRLPGEHAIGTVDIVIGRVVAVHIADHVIVDGKVDIARIRPIARLGYFQYCCIGRVFELEPPAGAALRAGLEGSAEKAQTAIRG